MSRYKSTDKIFNKGGIYQELLDERGVAMLQQYRTQKWPLLTEGTRRSFSATRHIWKLGDSYWKIAGDIYGRPSLWWLIAWFNRRPTEAHNRAGDIILIPSPVEELLSLFNYGAR
jgi:nucleoid-associated protein YgaU